MICVSIGRGRHRHVIAEHRHLVEKGAQLVELRLDYINGQINLRRVLSDRPGPVVVTIRRPQDGGKFSGTEDARRMLLRQAIVDGVDYVDLEEDVAAITPRYGKTKRIISYHNFQNTPEDLPAIHARLAKLDPDIVKLATLAHHPRDNVRMLELIAESKVPTVGLCMGDIGTPSRILAGKFGAPFTYATFHQERALAPGQLSFDQMVQIYNYDSIDADTEIYGVIGDPIAHSLSPLIHNAAFSALGLDKRYLPFRVPRDDLLEFLDDCRNLGLRGLSVTIPHKEGVLTRVTDADPLVRGIGAANTLLFDGGQVRAFNTDCQAAADALAYALGEHVPGAHQLEIERAIVLGAGGAAKAVAFGLMQRGTEVVIVSRTRGRADQLAKQLGCKSDDWDRRHDINAGLIVNCTPIGMHPNVDESPYDKGQLDPRTIVFDTVYNPENTLLLKDARALGCTTVSGTEMFIRQADLQFRLFSGREAPADLMHETLRRAIGAARY